MSELLDPVQRTAAAPFDRQSRRYAQGHILENIEDLRVALARAA